MIYKDYDIIRSINATNLLNTMENDFRNYTINIEDNSYGYLSKNLRKEEKEMKDILSKKNEYIDRINNILFNHRIDVNKIKYDFKKYFNFKKKDIDRDTNEKFQRIIENAYKNANEDKKRIIEQIRRYYNLLLIPLEERLSELQGGEFTDETGKTKAIIKLDTEGRVNLNKLEEDTWNTPYQKFLIDLRALIDYDINECKRSQKDCSNLTRMEREIKNIVSSLTISQNNNQSAQGQLDSSVKVSKGYVQQRLDNLIDTEITDYEKKLIANTRTMIENISRKLLLQLDIKWGPGTNYTTLTSLNYNNQGGRDYYVVAPSAHKKFDLKITIPNNLTYLIITEPNTHPSPLWDTHLKISEQKRTTPADSSGLSPDSYSWIFPKSDEKCLPLHHLPCSNFKKSDSCPKNACTWKAMQSGGNCRPINPSSSAVAEADRETTLKNCAKYVGASDSEINNIKQSSSNINAGIISSYGNLIYSKLNFWVAEDLCISKERNCPISLGENRFMLTLVRKNINGIEERQIYNLIITVPQ
tara:strand:+ start:3643 stop:5226 length:1584 start_codon:yes stop_codon:yes gene_type:complete